MKPLPPPHPPGEVEEGGELAVPIAEVELAAPGLVQVPGHVHVHSVQPRSLFRGVKTKIPKPKAMAKTWMRKE